MFGQKWFVLLMLLAPVPPGAGGWLPEYPVRPIADYPIFSEKFGLTIAAHPIDDVKEQGAYFGAKLIRKGILPVLIVMKNASAGESFLVKKSSVVYRVEGELLSLPSTPEVRSKVGEVTGQAGPIDPRPLIGPFVQIGNVLMANAADVQQNLLKRELQSRTLSPGASYHGFLYVRIPKGSFRGRVHLRVPVIRPGAEEPIVFELVF